MSGAGWLRVERDALAAERILDAAGHLFADEGVTQVGMGEIARAAGCSRATLYRYFESRHALRTAYVHREARRVAEGVAADLARVEDPEARIVEGVLLAVAAVRRSPEMAAWFTDVSSGIANDLAGSSEVIEVLAMRFLVDAIDTSDTSAALEDDTRQRARWLVRVIVSLLAMPEGDEEAERTLVQRFVAPAVLAPARAVG